MYNAGDYEPLCGSLKVGATYTLRKEVMLSWMYSKFENGTVKITGLLDEEVPGCSCKEVKLIRLVNVKLFHPIHIVDCQACRYYVSYQDRGKQANEEKANV